MSIKVLYEDRSIIIVQKPAGIATQTANVLQPDCVSLIKEHIRKSGSTSSQEPYIGVVHRLDQPVEGLLVFAKNKNAAASLSGQVREGILNKHYRAVVEGIIDSRDDTLLIDQIYKDTKRNMAVITDKTVPGIKLKEARLIYHTEKIIEGADMTILSIKLITGRFHQIRAQLSNMGHPIAGDNKYGAHKPYPSGIALVADRLEFRHPDTGEKVEKNVDFSFAL